MLLWGRAMIRQYDTCAARLDDVLKAWPKP